MSPIANARICWSTEGDGRRGGSRLRWTAGRRRSGWLPALIGWMVLAAGLGTEVRAQIPTAITLSPAVASPTYTTPVAGGAGSSATDPVTLTATVTYQGTPPTPGTLPVTGGTVTFYDTTNINSLAVPFPLATVNLQFSSPSRYNPNTGTATLVWAFGPGTHNVTAVYSGTSGSSGTGPYASTPNYLPSTTATASVITVNGHGATAFSFQVLSNLGTEVLWDPLAAYTTNYYPSQETENPSYGEAGIFGFGLQMPTGTYTITDTTTGTPYVLPPDQYYSQLEPYGTGFLTYTPLFTGIPNLGGTNTNGEVNEGNYLYSLGVATVTSFTTADLTQAGLPGFLAVSTGNGSAAQNPQLTFYQLYDFGGICNCFGSFPIAPSPAQVVAADVNGDGLLDAVIAHNDTASGVGIAQNTLIPGNNYQPGLFGGQTGLGVPLERLYPVSHPVGNVAVGDVNGDGIPDVIALTSDGSNLIFILLGNGDGTFSVLPNALTAGMGASSIGIADFNQDGILDIAVLNPGENDVGIFTGNGDGTFSSMAVNPVDATPTAFTVADLNLDGYPDIAITNSLSTTTAEVSFLYGQAGGGFSYTSNASTYQLYLEALGYPESNPHPTVIQAVDLNGDGYPDLFIGENINQIYYGEYNPTLGQYFFSQQQYYDQPNSINQRTNSAAVADLDGDGVKDILTITPNNDEISQPNDNNLLFRYTGALVFDSYGPMSVIAPLGNHNFTASYVPDSSAGPVYGNASAGPVTLDIIQSATVSLTSSVTFAAETVGFTEGPMTATLTNTGNLPVGISSVSLNTAYGDYTQFAVVPSTVNACPVLPATLAVGASCLVSFTFTPTAQGYFSDQAIVATTNAGTVYTTLYGGGVPPPANLQVNVEETIVLTDVPSEIFTVRYAVPETIVLTDADIAEPTARFSVPETIILTDAPSDTPTVKFSVSETIILTDAPSAATVVQHGSQVAITGPSHAYPGQVVTVIATTSGIGTTDIPTGSVNFYDNGVLLGAVAIDGTGTSVYQYSTSSLGTHQIDATYAGSAEFTPPTVNNFLAITVAQYGSQVAITGPSHAYPGQVVTVIATTSGIGTTDIPTGSVNFYDNGVLLGPVAIDGTGKSVYQYSTSSLGTHQIDATYAGNAEFTPPSVNNFVSITVAQYSSQVAITGPSHAYPGQVVTVIATTSGIGTADIPTGSVNFYDNGVLLGPVAIDGTGKSVYQYSTTSLGTHQIDATYAGNAEFSPPAANNFLGITVAQYSSQVAITGPSHAYPGQVVTVTATTSGIGTADIPTGSVNFYDNGVLLGPVAIDGTGRSVYQYSTTSLGTHQIDATYAGNAEFSPTTVNNFVAITVVPQVTQTIKFLPLPTPIPLSLIHTLMMTAHSTSGLPITYSVTGPATVSGSTVTLTGTGPVTVTASQAGSVMFAPATSVVRGFTVTP